jgi:sulfur carrier protein
VITLNGQSSKVAAGATVAAVLEGLSIEGDARGVAVAVDGQVVPRAEWRTFTLPEHARVEVLTAMQGG